MGDIVLTLDSETLAFKSVTIDGKVAKNDQLQAEPIDVSTYTKLTAFEPWTFLVFKNEDGTLRATYAKRRDCTYFWV